MSTHQIHVFISHSWDYSDHYKTLSDWIFTNAWRSGQATFDLRNFSVPKTNPILNASNDAELQAAIYEQIKRSHVIVIPTGKYATHRKWIRKEIDGANLYKKPILAVDLWGAKQASSVVRAAAAETVGWNQKPLVAAIWRLHQEWSR